MNAAFIASTEQPILRLRPGPQDANLRGDIFGGWLMSQIDIAGGITATKETNGLTATRAVKELTFLQPLFIYDLVSFFTEVLEIGKTSITVKIQTFAQRFNNQKELIKISDAVLVYVAISEPGQKRVISK